MSDDVQNNFMLMTSDLLIKVSALENALLKKEILNKSEIDSEAKKITSKLSDLMKKALEESLTANNIK